MSVDTAFQPKGPTVLVTNSAIQAVSTGNPLYNSMVSFRIVNLAATAAGFEITPGQGATTA